MIDEPLCDETHNAEILDFAQRISALELSRVQFAMRLNRDPGNLSRWLGLRTRMTLRNFERIKSTLAKLEQAKMDKLAKATTLKKHTS